jgi:hypothetical protein
MLVLEGSTSKRSQNGQIRCFFNISSGTFLRQAVFGYVVPIWTQRIEKHENGWSPKCFRVDLSSCAQSCPAIVDILSNKKTVARNPDFRSGLSSRKSTVGGLWETPYGFLSPIRSFMGLIGVRSVVSTIFHWVSMLSLAATRSRKDLK